MKSLIVKLLVVAPLLAAGLCNSANAQLINVHFGGGSFDKQNSGAVPKTETDQSLHPYKGSAVIGSGGDIWNSFDATKANTTLDLVDSTGAATSAKINFQVDQGYVTADPADAFIGGRYNNLMASYFFTYGESQPKTITITGLPEGRYDLYIYSQNNKPSSTTFLVGDQNATTSVIDPGKSARFVKGTNYAEFDGVVVSTSGTLTFTYASADKQPAIINGFQLQSENSELLK